CGCQEGIFLRRESFFFRMLFNISNRSFELLAIVDKDAPDPFRPRRGHFAIVLAIVLQRMTSRAAKRHRCFRFQMPGNLLNCSFMATHNAMRMIMSYAKSMHRIIALADCLRESFADR